MKVIVDYTRCSGIGLCEMTAPAVFEVGDDGQSHVLKHELSPDERATVEEAIAACPTGALSVEE